MGNRSAADSQFDLAFTHMDLDHFNVFEESNYGNFGNLNFITGAGTQSSSGKVIATMRGSIGCVGSTTYFAVHYAELP